jgi:large subunit ribosomal protein L23
MSNKKQVTERMYDIISYPIITEKAMGSSEHGHVTFKVPLDASKPEIRTAVETIFDVKVNSVNTVKQLGKQKRFRGRLGKRSDYKKAIVKLAEGQNIDVTTGI